MDENLKHYSDDFYKMHVPWQADYDLISRWIHENVSGNIFGDIGCGNGYIIQNLYNEYNKKVWGVDGSDFFMKNIDTSILPMVRRVDLTGRIKLDEADVAICLEVAEHIPMQFSDTLVKNIVSTKAKTLIFTAAPPGQEGVNHINLQLPEFWLEKFEKYGYELDKKISEKFRKDLDGKLAHTTWYLDNWMVLHKRDNFIKSELSVTPRLVMTLLVRDEADIIERNIDFHLKYGVDYIIATDNGSVDGTRDILLKYQKKGVLELIDEKEQNYAQAEWVNRMGRIAYEKYNADIIFHCDADEFWFPKSGNLKNEISNKHSKDMLRVGIVNVLLEENHGHETFPNDNKWAVVNPYETENIEEDSKNKNLYLFRYPPKVIYKTEKGNMEVVQGNHDIANKKGISIGDSREINIFHYPLRSKEHFFQKIKNGGSAYETNKALGKNVGFHWRRWYESYKNGNLEKEYRKLVLTKNNIIELKDSGIIEKHNFSYFFDNLMIWRYYNPKFEYEERFRDLGWPWAGHKNFAYDFVRNFQPKTIVELGTHKGTSFWSFCQATKDEKIDSKLFAVDTWRGEEHAGFYGEEIFEGVKEIQKKYYGDLKTKLIRKTFDEALAFFQDESIDLLHIDGLHTYEAVKHDFENWNCKVKKNGIIILHDIFVNQNDFGVYRLWEELKKKYKTIEFYHSFGLGVVFKDEKKYEDFLGKEKEMQMKYSSLSEERKNEEINSSLDVIRQKDRNIRENDQDIREKNGELQRMNSEIDRMKSSKFWKMRDSYIRYKKILTRLPFLIIKGSSVITKYGAGEFLIRLKNLYKSPEENIEEEKRYFDEEEGAEKKYLSEVLNDFAPLPSELPVLSLRDPIDIIIPIYNGYEYLEVLMESIFSNTTLAYRLILIDDCSTDGRIGDFLKTLMKKKPKGGEILVLKNKTNMGFVKTANLGMKLAKNNFIIINTDTEVPKGWLERLIFPIYQYENIASVTPFTNAGEICSFPLFLKNNKIFENLKVGEIDNFFQHVKSEKNYINLPTGVGFCMAINKRVADEIGFFDEDNFGKGYGEENDWCQRAIEKGYKNIIAPNLFIYHKHGGSFSSEEKKKLQQENLKKLTRKHKNYLQEVSDFIKRDLLKNIRDFLILLISAKCLDKNKPLLFIDHELGGGANFYRDDFIKEELKKCNSVLLLTWKKESRDYSLKYFYKKYEIYFYLKHYKEIEKLFDFIQIKKIIVNGLVSFGDPLEVLSFVKNIAKKGCVKTEFLVHDYFCLCPNYVLIGTNGDFCNLPRDMRICEKCLLEKQKNPSNGTEVSIINADILEWRTAWKKFLDSVDRITCFSNSSREMLTRVYPELLNGDRIAVRHHKVEYLKKVKEDLNLTIGILGGINYIKGIRVVKEALSLVEAENLKIKIVILGETSEEMGNKNIIVHGKYNREEIQRLTVSYGIDLFLIPSIIPETFSYTTEEIIKMNYPVAVFDLGAPAERVKLYEKGIIIPKIDARSALDAILEFSEKNKLKG
jgi:O-antigen biosynthesis protein